MSMPSTLLLQKERETILLSKLFFGQKSLDCPFGKQLVAKKYREDLSLAAAIGYVCTCTSAGDAKSYTAVLLLLLLLLLFVMSLCSSFLGNAQLQFELTSELCKYREGVCTT